MQLVRAMGGTDADIWLSSKTLVVVVTRRRLTAMTRPQGRIWKITLINLDISSSLGSIVAAATDVSIWSDDDERVSAVDADDVRLVDLLEDERLDDGGERATTLVFFPSHRARGRDLNLGHLQKFRTEFCPTFCSGLGFDRKSFITFSCSVSSKVFVSPLRKNQRNQQQINF